MYVQMLYLYPSLVQQMGKGILKRQEQLLEEEVVGTFEVQDFSIYCVIIN